MEFTMIVLFIGIVIAVIFGAMALWGLKHALFLAVNSVIGFFALYAVQAYVLQELVINIWSTLIVAIFGIVGLLVVLLLHWVGVWF